MTYPFAESQFLSRRLIAAAGIVMLHGLVGYFLVTGLMHTITVNPSTPLTGVVLQLPRKPPALPPPAFKPDRLRTQIVVSPPPAVPEDPPQPDSVRSVPVSPLTPSSALAPPADPIRVIGRHQLPDSEDYYPDELRRLRVQGATNMQVCVDERGVRRGEPQIEQTSGSERLDMAALNVARHGRYARSVQGETPVANCYHFRIIFKLN
jgi:outer membrane biosynthesis protein TonB